MINQSLTSTEVGARNSAGATPLDVIRILIVVAGLATGLAITVQHLRMNNFPVDMVIYREGVRAFFTGGQVYTEPMRAGSIALPFIYPPFAALVLGPLALPFISHNVAGNIMITASCLAILACLYAVTRTIILAHPKSQDRYGQWMLPLACALWPAALSMEPIRLNDSFAQINVMIMALVVADLVPRRRKLPQGWLIGVAVAIKIFPAAMLLFFLLQRQIRPILVAGISALIATALGAMVRIDQAIIFFRTTLLSMGADSEFGVDSTYTSNSSLKALVMRATPTRQWLDNHEMTVNVIWVVLVLITIAAGAWLMLALLARSLDTLAWLVNAIVMLLVSPISWSHHWVWLALFLPLLTCWVVDCWSIGKRLYPTMAITGLFSFFVLTVPPKWWFGDGISFDKLGVVPRFLVSDFVWLSIALLVAIAWDIRSIKRNPVGSPAT